MKRVLIVLLFALTMVMVAPTVYSQQSSGNANRERTREQLGQLLDKVGPKIKVSFRQSEKQPFNFVRVLKDGITSADSFEIVISVSAQSTIHFRIFPHYNGSYLNVDKVRNGVGLMRKMLRFSDQNFLFWGMDDSSDIFAGYNFTLESGFPEEAVTVVLNSISKLDQYVGEMKVFADASSAPSH